MTETRSILKAVSTVDSKLSNLPIEDGQLIFVYDKKKIVLDNHGIRTIYEQIQTIENEDQRKELLAPIDSFYFVIETSILWRYANGQWIQITSQPAEKVIVKDSYLKFPPIGSSNQIYIDTTENATYRWDDKSLKYYCVGRDYMNIKIIDGCF